MQQLKPFVDQGGVQLAPIPMSILNHEDRGLRTKAALSLVTRWLPTWELQRRKSMAAR